MSGKISKRDVKVFVLGMLTILILELALDFDGTAGDFIRGFKEGYNAYPGK